MNAPISTGRTVLVAALIAAHSLVAGAAPEIEFEEVENRIRSEYLHSIHEEDMDDCLSSLRAKGVSDARLSEVFEKIVLETKDAPPQSDESVSFNIALGGFAQTADRDRLGTLLDIAASTTNEYHATCAFVLYHGKMANDPAFLDQCRKTLIREDLSDVLRSTIWDHLAMDHQKAPADSVVRERIATMARDFPDSPPMTFFSIDRILSADDSSYRDSSERATLAEKALSDIKSGARTTPIVTRHFESILERKAP